MTHMEPQWVKPSPNMAANSGRSLELQHRPEFPIRQEYLDHLSAEEIKRCEQTASFGYMGSHVQHPPDIFTH